ncbi:MULTISPECIES: gamma-glutamyltransferase [unclassified Saccharibacter]|uniref:gamma-glutamyltransferase n=1 Tax=unclassified Saccharibacter TaxID=2648722 RepID=UPI00351B3D55
MAQSQSRFLLPCPAPRKRPSMLRATSLLGTLLLTSSAVTGCSTMHSLHHHLFGPTQKVNAPNSGTVVADEPQAALVGRDVLARGGNAADAATATGFALGVTLPSRASLGGGGACLVSRPHETAQTISFLPSAGSSTGDRPATVPMMARGLYALQTRYGSVAFGDTLDPAITLAQQGMTVSQALSRDLSVVGTALLSNAPSLSVFGRDSGAGAVQMGDRITQTRLTSFLSRLKLVGIGDLYNGALAETFVTQANQAGGGLTREDLRHGLPLQTGALTLSTGPYQTSLLAPPADGGIGSAAAYRTGGSAQNAVSAWRHSGLHTVSDAQGFITQNHNDAAGLPPLPASTSFVVTDGNGMTVSCALSENNLFGTGRMAGTTGVILGAGSPRYPHPLLSAAIVHDRRGRVRAALAASGQNEAADTLAQALRQVSADQPITPRHGEGRLNSISCGRTPSSCQGNADPQGNGMSAHTLSR